MEPFNYFLCWIELFEMFDHLTVYLYRNDV